MLSGFAKLVERSRRVPVVPAAFFGAYFLFAWLRISPALIYDSYRLAGQFRAWVAGGAFLEGFLQRPGGFADYASAFLSQVYFRSWAGALVIAALGAAMALGTWVLLSAPGRARPSVLHLIPAVLLLLLFGRYVNALGPGLAFCVAALSAAAFAVLRGSRMRLAGFAVLAALTYYVGGAALLALAATCTVLEVSEGRWPAGLACLAWAAALPYVIGSVCLGLLSSAAYGARLPVESISTASDVLVWSLWIFLPAVTLASAVGRRWPGMRSRLARAWPYAARLSGGVGERPRRLVAVVAFFGASALVVHWGFDTGLAAQLRIEHYDRLDRFEAVLAEARRLPLKRYDLPVHWAVNRALFHLGRLGDAMFSYPQRADGLVPMPQDFDPARVQRGGARAPLVGYAMSAELLYELGSANLSEAMAHEAWERAGWRPSIIQRLAWINAAKGQMDAARQFVGSLSGDVVLGSWARARLSPPGAGHRLGADQQVLDLQTHMVAKDAAGLPALQELLLSLLERDPRNRMAFGYLMAHCMLTCRLGVLAASVHRLDDFGLRGIPRHYEEALLVYADVGGPAVDLGGRSISLATEERFRRFKAELKRYAPDMEAARRALAPEFRDSYFFYFAFAPPSQGQP
jgi:hypothetical protein